MKKLLWSLVYNDLKKNCIMSVVLGSFLLLSAILMAGGLRVTGTMLSATKGLNQIAMPPEYLQMHKGDYDAATVQEFADTHDYILNSQIVAMLNIDNANILYKGETMEKYLMDNGFIVQNDNFDYLLDMNNDIAVVRDGEVGVPVYYHEELGIEVGDVLIIKNGIYQKELTVTTLIRDAQMNAALTSSKRFLISETDQTELSMHTGEWEYSFEYILKPDTDVKILERDYADKNMPSNGVAITGNLLHMINSLSYGLIAFLLLAVSLLLIFIALLCLSYIIRATLADEQRTIGTMQAIGLSANVIEKLYLLKYMILAMAAGIFGYFIAIPFSGVCSESVVLYCGIGHSRWMPWICSILGIIVLELLVVVQCRKIIRKNLKSTVVALLHGEEAKRKEGCYQLPKRKRKRYNVVIALGELSCKWKEYMVLFLVFMLSTFLILLPINIQTTTEDPSFITYMGIGKCDIRVDMQYSDDLEKQKEALCAYLKEDKEISRYAVYQNGYVQVQNSEEEWEYLRVSSGDEMVFPLSYLEGSIPSQKAEDKEIALSYMEAEELHKGVGDTIQVKIGSTDLTQTITAYTVSGIYQDITYGGKTAKMKNTFTEQATEGYVIYLELKDGVSISDKAEEIRGVILNGRVTPIIEFIKQTLGGVIDHLGTMVLMATALSLFLIILISTMFFQLVTAREHSAIAIKKSIGFTNHDIRMQFGIRLLVIQGIAIIAGTILTNTFGEALFGAMMSTMGTTKITMLINPLISYAVSPLLQIIVCVMTTVSATRVIRNYHVRDIIVE